MDKDTDKKVGMLEARIKVLEKALGIQNHYDIPEQKPVNPSSTFTRPLPTGSESPRIVRKITTRGTGADPW